MHRALKTELVSRCIRFLLPLALLTCAQLLRNLTTSYLSYPLPPFLTLYPAVALVALRAGFRTGVLSTAYATLLVAFWTLQPAGYFRITELGDVIALAVFAGMGVMVSAVAEQLHNRQRRILELEKDQALSASQVKLQTALESMSDAIFISDTEGRFIDFNTAFATFHRFRNKEECARTLEEYPAFLEVRFPGGEVAPLEMWAVPRALRGESGSNVEYELHRKDTGERWTGSYTFGPLRDEKGRIIGSVVAGRDVTEQKRAAETLQTSELRFRTAFETSRDGIAIFRVRSQKFVNVNPEFVRITGWEREELLGHTSKELNLFVDLTERQILLDTLARDGFFREFPVQLRRKTGEIFWGVFSTTVMEIDGVQHAHAVLRDVTEQHRAEEERRESEARYRAAFHTSLDAIAINRMDNQRYVDVNEAFERIFGYRREEMVGRSSPEMQIWVDPAERTLLYERLRCGSAVQDMVFAFRKKSGERSWGTLSASLIELNGVSCTLAVIRDVTQQRMAEQVLRASEFRYRTVFETSKDAIAIIRASDETVMDVNHAWSDLYGYSREEIAGNTARRIALWVDEEARQTIYGFMHRHEEVQGVEFNFRKKNGEQGWGTATISNIEIDGIACALFVVRDVTEARRSKEILHASEARYRTIFQASHDPLLVTRNNDGTYVDASQAFLHLTGWSREEVIGSTSGELNLWVDMERRARQLPFLERSESQLDVEARFRKKNGEIFVGMLTSVPMEVNGEECCLTTLRDVTAVRQAEEEIRNLSYFDPLTGLANRRLLCKRLEEEARLCVRDGHHLALLCLYLDNLETINNAFGRGVTEIVLRQVGHRISRCVHESCVVMHQEGSEFYVLLSHLDNVREAAADQARLLAEKIAPLLEAPCTVEGHECICACSIGITICTGESAQTGDALQRAHIAMQKARAAGRSTFQFYSSDLQEAITARAALEEEMRHGIRAGEFTLFYQPQLAKERLVGAEALLRWRHPRLGLLAPAQFIHLAEETRLILPLGHWTLEAACQQIALWAQNSQLSSMKVAVNISAPQFYEPDFVDAVLQALEHTGAAPHSLMLELTESILVEDMDVVVARMQALRAHGVRFSLDDFGTGYSSLSYLKRLPLSQLKIDRAFVHDILTDTSSAAIAQAVLSLSQTLGIPVIAEGVETEEQSAMLCRIGCREFQGYLFGKPMAVGNFEATLPQFLASTGILP